MWIDPHNGDRMAVAGDGGISIQQRKNWHRTFLPIAQLYHVTTDNNIPYNVLTNRQDGPSMKGPSRTRSGMVWSWYDSIRYVEIDWGWRKWFRYCRSKKSRYYLVKCIRLWTTRRNCDKYNENTNRSDNSKSGLN